MDQLIEVEQRRELTDSEILAHSQVTCEKFFAKNLYTIFVQGHQIGERLTRKPGRAAVLRAYRTHREEYWNRANKRVETRTMELDGSVITTRVNL